jgi:hypothetical protein
MINARNIAPRNRYWFGWSRTALSHNSSTMRMKALVALFIPLFVAFSYPHGTKDRLAYLSRNADLIVRATVQNKVSRWITNHHGGKSISTLVTLQTHSIVKGDFQENTFTIDVPGGIVGNIAQGASESPRWSSGEEAILFLQTNPVRLFYLQGVIPVLERNVRIDEVNIPVEYFVHYLQALVRNPAQAPPLPEKSPEMNDKPNARPGTPNDLPFTAPKQVFNTGVTLTDTFSITNVRVTNIVDVDSNGYRESFQLHWDPNVNVDSQRYVYSVLWGKQVGTGTWSVIGEEYRTIVGTQPDDVSLHIQAENSTQQNWDFRIDLEVYRDTGWVVMATAGPADYSVLHDIPLQTYISISAITPDKSSGGTNSTVVITGQHFGSLPDSSEVRLPNSEPDPYYRTDLEIVSWSDNRIEGILPTISSGEVQVITPSGRSNHFDFRATFNWDSYVNGGFGKWSGLYPNIPFYINENDTSVKNGGAAIRAAAATWNAVGANFKYVYAGTTTKSGASFDSVNVISWDDLGNGELGETDFTWDTLTGLILDADIVLNLNYPWSTDSVTGSLSIDVQVVVLHEFGHGLGLLHVSGNLDSEYDNAKVMYPYYDGGEVKRSLHRDDAAGIAWIYGAVLPAETAFCFSGGSGSVAVSLPDSTAWTASSNTPWITIMSGESGIRHGIVTYRVERDSNTTVRSGTMTIAGRQITIDQSQVCRDVIAGWNMMSLPLSAQSGRVKSLFPSAVSRAFSYEGGYQDRDSLQPGIGFWVKFPTAATATISVLPVLGDTINIRQGWNIIGSMSVPISLDHIGSDPPGIIFSSLYGYQGGATYLVMDTVQPGGGYWLKANQNGKLILNPSSSAISASNRIRIKPTQELPPSPPNQSPVRTTTLPAEYELAQAYPNPFNPTTTIRYQLPNESHVSLKVYDLLGQVVATLSNEIEPAGYKQENWNASGFASGVYFYRLETTSTTDPSKSFTQVKKMSLVR